MTTTNASATTPATTAPDVELIVTTATTASGTDVSAPTPTPEPAISGDKVLYAPATTPVRWLSAISKKMGVSLRITSDQAAVLAAADTSTDYGVLLNRTCTIGGEERILKALGAITPEEQELLKKTLTLSFVNRNVPIYQCCSVKYFTNVQSWIMNREPKKVSLQDYLNKVGLSSLYSEVGLDLFEATFPDRYQHWDWNSVEFHRINGLHHGEEITEVYTNVDPYDTKYEDVYPSPWGSCMRRDEWSYDGYSLGVDCDYDHPVAAYATEDVDLAWVTDKETGKTLARCLINNKEHTVSRVYALGLNLKTYDYQKRSQKELKDKLIEFIGLPVDEHTGLKNCRFLPQFIDDDTIVAPYIDGSYYFFDANTGIIGDAGEFNCTEHNPPVVYREGKKHVCGQCGDRCDDDEDVYFDGEWWCRECSNEHLIFCANCDEYSYTEDSTYCEDSGEWYCDSCASRHLTRCDHCGEWFLNDSVTLCSSDDDYYCDYCMEAKDIQPCDSCGEYYFADELDEDMHCCHCHRESEDTNE